MHLHSEILVGVGVEQFTVLELTRLTETWINDFPGSKQLSMSFDGTVRLRTYMGFRSSLRGERLVSKTTSSQSPTMKHFRSRRGEATVTSGYKAYTPSVIIVFRLKIPIRTFFEKLLLEKAWSILRCKI